MIISTTLLSGTGPYSALATTIDGESLRLWASIGESSFNELRRGETLQLSSLPSDCNDKINRLVYWLEGLDDNTLDPTECLPKGITGGTLSLTSEDKPVFYGWAAKDGPPATPGPMDTTQFGKNLAVWQYLLGGSLLRLQSLRSLSNWQAHRIQPPLHSSPTRIASDDDQHR